MRAGRKCEIDWALSVFEFFMTEKATAFGV